MSALTRPDAPEPGRPSPGEGTPPPETGPEAVAAPAWRGWLRVLPLLALVALSLGLLFGGITRWFSVDQLLASRAYAKAWVADGFWRAYACAYLAYVGTVIVSLPVSVVMTTLCGFLFGPVLGALVSIASATTGAVIVFSIGRTAAGEVLLRRAGSRLGRLAEGFRRDAFSYVMVLRLLPVFPFWMTNLAPAIFGVRLRTFALATLIGISPGAFIYASAGAGVETVVAAHQAAKEACLVAGGIACDAALSLRAVITPQLIATLLGLGVLALLPVAWRRWRGTPR
ncbi:TVP38/TMEM64 family protein [Methylobacterium terricola]|uniref:TVP38/TMEM64 family membrane protein n=1 Tax=Methylobacterium terricola TaxID=2583531 RepID=A0A5C4LIT0_9HYPH|nr:TVP38/TMEM64 family protein [Methylobacterium terricola]TNC12814.1 TVP38/TMEM64 family protein [Methylobacterium terricola]